MPTSRFLKNQNCVFGLNKRRAKKLKSGQIWANVGQTFGIICFLNFEFEGAAKKIRSKIYFRICCIIRGGQMKLMAGKTWTNVGQTFGRIVFLNFEFGIAIFTLFEKVKLHF